MAPHISFAWNDFGLWQRIVTLFVGGMMVTGGANTINQILERDSDRLMKRTRLRPLPDGRMGDAEAWIFAGVTGVVGALLLGYYFNALAGMLSFLSLLLYAFAYTPMKKIHPIAVLIGAIPGALPPLIGWVAATGSMDIGGIVLFTLQFFWQFPHFWAIAWVAHGDYSKAGFKLLPSQQGPTKFTALQTVIYSLLMVPGGFLPYLLGMSGEISMWILLVANIFMIVQCIRLYVSMDVKKARYVMFSSYLYLPVVLLAMLADKADKL
jgi:protoheme IX farnesyltransferase